MFYSQYILAKRGPLGTIWIAAHLDRRLRKQQITETDIAEAVRESPIHRPSPEFFRLASQNSSFSVGRAASPGGARDSSRGGFDRVEPGETRENDSAPKERRPLWMSGVLRKVQEIEKHCW